MKSEVNEIMTDSSIDVQKLIDNISLAVLGAEYPLKLVVSTLLAGGHALIEDVPGVGKTTLAVAMARSMSIEFRRIQFVSDLLPADLLGISVYDPGTRKFRFNPGPVFTNFLLADEINRGTARVQSALLEVMSNAQVSVDGITHALSPPFFVMATLNPMESHGVYDLPESQLDRFMIRFRMGYPESETEMRLMSKAGAPIPPEHLQPVTDGETVQKLKKQVETVKISRDMIAYMMSIISATRNHAEISLGASPRAGRHLSAMCRAWAFVHGRNYVIPDDIKELSRPVLAHRLMLRSAENRSDLQNGVITDILSSIPVPL